MGARPLLEKIAAALTKVWLDAILVGNAAAAIHGAPVTTVDFDFLFRRTPTNLAKLKRFAALLNAVVLQPCYPASDLYRVMNDGSGLQVDFMVRIHGIRSFNSLRSRALRVEIGGLPLWVASLEDVVASKRAAARARDRAVPEILERTLDEKVKGSKTARQPQGGARRAAQGN